MSAIPTNPARLPDAPQPSQPGNDRDTDLPPTLTQLVGRWARRATIGAVAVSLVVHAIGWLLAAFIVLGGGGMGGDEGGGDGGAVEMAVMTEGQLAGIEAQGMGFETPAVPDAPTLVDPDLVGIMDAAAVDDGGLEAEIGDVGAAGGAGDIGTGVGTGLGGAGGGGASFFGVEAQGNRFAYIVDVSGSMVDSRIVLLRNELSRSVDGLLDTSEFMIVAFSDEATIVGEGKGWVQASPGAKRSARTHIGLMMPLSGTVPLPAFELVLGKRPRPDAIYFMTDGEFAVEMADAILDLNKTYKVPIHCICLDSQQGEQVMKRIARQTKGTYNFVRAQP